MELIVSSFIAATSLLLLQLGVLMSRRMQAFLRS